MKEFIISVLGTDSVSGFMTLAFFAFIGVILSLLLQTTKRDPNSPHTPFEFSWKFLMSDNSKRFLAGLIMIYVSLRFTPELFGVTINAFWAFGIGFCSDKIAEFIKNKTNLLGK